MRTIQTRIFKLDNVWQLGFEGITKSDAVRLKDLRGLRFCSGVRLWHIAHHVNTISYLNRTYDGEFYFLPDPGPRDAAPRIASPDKERIMRVVTHPPTDSLFCSHTFNREVFHRIGKLSGTSYDRDRRRWVMSISGHLDALKAICDKFGFELLEMEHRDAPDGRPGRQDSPPMSREEMMSRFRKELYIRNRSNRTMKSYLTYAREFLNAFPGQDPQQLSSDEIRAHMHQVGHRKNYSYSTMNLKVSAIKIFYQYVFNIDLKAIDLPRPKKEKRLPKVISEQEVHRMIDLTPNLKHRTILATLYSTAIRREELLNIKLTDLDLENRMLRVHGKGNKDRCITLSQNLVGLLKDYLRRYAPQVYLIEGGSGAQYSTSSITNVVRQAGQRARIRINVSPHMLRHSYATHLLNKGVNILFIQKILGHSDIKTTLIYTHIANNDLKNLPNPFDEMKI